MPTLGIVEKMYPWTEGPRSILAAEPLPGKELYKLRKPGSFVNYRGLFPEESDADSPRKVSVSAARVLMLRYQALP